MCTSYYCYHFSNEHVKFLTPTQAQDYALDHDCHITYDGYHDMIKKVSSSKPTKIWRNEGWHPGLGMNITSQNQYREILKERGLIEVGNEKPTHKEEKKSFYNDQIIKGIVDQGADLSGNEIAALKSGEKLHVD